jgi:hypothetical protein
MKWMLVLRSEYDVLVKAHQEHCERTDKIEHRVAKLELLFAAAARHVPGAIAPTVNTDLRRPMNTWRTRATKFTKESQVDPSTFQLESKET